MTDTRALPDGRVPQDDPPADAPAGRLWAVDPLTMEVSGGKIVISSPRVEGRLSVGPAVAGILISARDGVDPAEHPHATISRLTKAGFLTEDRAGLQSAGAPWGDWGVTAWNFHHRIRNTDFVSQAKPGRLQAYADRLVTRPRPPSVREPASDRILLLPRVRSPLNVSFREVLEGRRTHRHFEEQTLALEKFSDLLHYTFAPLRFADAAELGTLQLRAAASGGARHETEAFVFVFNVASVEPGLYHYDNIRHGLEPIRSDAGRADLENITHGQGFFEHAAFGVLTAAVAERMSWKYPHPVAYRMLLQNIGHMAQVFSMTAAALGLGAALTGAIKESVAEPFLGLRQPGEFTTFALACGTPVRRPEDGLPRSIRLPRSAPEYY